MYAGRRIKLSSIFAVICRTGRLVVLTNQGRYVGLQLERHTAALLLQRGAIQSQELPRDFHVSQTVFVNIGNAVTIANNLCDSCPTPTEVEAQINASTIDVSWQAPAGSETDIRYRQKGNLAWKRALAVISPFEIPNLDECTLYEVQFRSIHR